MDAHFDRDEIIRAAKLLVPAGGITEVRALDAKMSGVSWKGTASGYFSSPAKLAEAVATIQSAKGVYIIPNAVNPALLARSANKLKVLGKSEPSTSDADIQRRHWLLIDLDPRRPSGISSTAVEHAAAEAIALEVRSWLKALDWPDPIFADSGNGYHLLYRIDLAPDDGGIVERCLESLAGRFDSDRVAVDTTVFNPARIWKLYGTMACKGDSLDDRPHRMSRLLDVPAKMEVVPVASLLSLAGPVAPMPERRGKAVGKFDLDDWVRLHLPEADGPKPWKATGQIWVLPVCPFNAGHAGGCAYVGRVPAGPIMAGCHHHSCKHWGWTDLRALMEPSMCQAGTAETAETGALWSTLGQPPVKRLLIRNLSEVKAEEVRWLWQDYIPAGMLSVTAGDPGDGKSMLSAYIAATVSTGRPWFGTSQSAMRRPGRVLLLSAEDDTACVVVPRLIAAGADMSLIDVIEGVHVSEGVEPTQVALDSDIQLLADEIRARPDVELVIIDPITAYLGRAAPHSHNTGVMRGLLSPLKTLCESTGVAIHVVSHLNKNEGSRNPSYRVTGSLGLVAQARANFLLARDPADENLRLWLPFKFNIGMQPPGLAFRIGTAPGKVEWQEGPVRSSAQEVLSQRLECPKIDAGDEAAADWLRSRLEAGPVEGKVVQEEAKTRGISSNCLQRATDRLRVSKAPGEFGGNWIWRLPPNATPPLFCKSPSVLQCAPVSAVPDGGVVSETGGGREGKSVVDAFVDVAQATAGPEGRT